MHVYLKCASQAKISKIIFNGKRGGALSFSPARFDISCRERERERLSAALSSKSVCLKETLG
jgi:hypothetical protein